MDIKIDDLSDGKVDGPGHQDVPKIRLHRVRSVCGLCARPIQPLLHPSTEMKAGIRHSSRLDKQKGRHGSGRK